MQYGASGHNIVFLNFGYVDVFDDRGSYYVTCVR
jgi:hypothetical protein